MQTLKSGRRLYQEQSPEKARWRRCSYKIRKIHRKIRVLEPVLQYSYRPEAQVFFCEFCKNFRNIFFGDIQLLRSRLEGEGVYQNTNVWEQGKGESCQWEHSDLFFNWTPIPLTTENNYQFIRKKGKAGCLSFLYDLLSRNLTR